MAESDGGDWIVLGRGSETQPLVTTVNLGWLEVLPRPDLPTLAIVELPLRTSLNGRGLAERQEMPRIHRADDVIERRFTDESGGGRVVALQIGAGVRRWIAHAGPGIDAAAIVGRCADELDEPELTLHEAHDDPEWRTYRTELQPSPDELIAHALETRPGKSTLVFRTLRSRGDRAWRTRRIDFYSYFIDEDRRAEYTAAIATRGFDVSTSEVYDRLYRFGATASIGSRPTPRGIRRFERHVIEATFRAHGLYDGWGTIVVRKLIGGAAPAHRPDADQ